MPATPATLSAEALPPAYALEMSLRISIERGDRRIAVGHVVLGILRPDRGTLPRALDMAGLDRKQLRDVVIFTLTFPRVDPYANP